MVECLSCLVRKVFLYPAEQCYVSSTMIVKQGKKLTTAKMFVKMLFVTVTILSPNLLLNDCCFKIIVDTLHVKLRKTFT